MTEEIYLNLTAEESVHLTDWPKINKQFIDEKLEKDILQKVEPLFGQADAIVVADNRHGLLTQNLIAQSIILSQKYQKPLYADCKIGKQHFYRGADCLFPNQKEAASISPALDPKEFIARVEKENIPVSQKETTEERKKCTGCGATQLRQNGTCMLCEICGETSGCS